MINDNIITITIAAVTSEFNGAISRCINWSTGRGSEIKPGMKLNRFIYRVDAIAKTGGNTFKICVAYWLDSRGGGQYFFFILRHSLEVFIRSLLYFDTAAHVI